MTRSRAADRVVGALGMLLLLVLMVVVLWWVVSTPAGSSTGPPGSPPVRDDAGSATDRPPADLADEEVWLADVDISAGTVVLPDSVLRDVQAVGHGVRSGGDGLVVADLDVQATVPFADVAAELGGDSEVGPAEDGQAMVVRTVEVLGREMAVVATGTVQVADGLLVVEPRSIDLGGPDVLSRGVAAVVRRFVTIEHPIQGLPENLVLQGVDVQEDGFRADLSGRDVVLVPADADRP